MSLAPPSAGLIERLRRDKHALAERVIEDMYVDPFWNERFAARGRKHSTDDLGFHVDYLIQAAEGNDPGVMERYRASSQRVECAHFTWRTRSVVSPAPSTMPARAPT